MMLAKLWIIVLGLGAACLLVLGALLPRPALRHLESEQAAGLRRAKQSAQLYLKLEARANMDRATELGMDIALAGALETGGKDTKALPGKAVPKPAPESAWRKSAEERLSELSQTRGFKIAIVLDSRGHVIGRIGPQAAIFAGDSLAGFPLISEALRGYSGEDAWLSGGELYQVAAAPILSAARDRYLGAVVLGTVFEGDLVKAMRDAVGAEVAVLVHGKPLATTLAPSALEVISAAAEHPGGDVVAGGAHASALWAVGVPLGGEASRQGVVYALATPRSDMPGFVTLLGGVGFEDIGPDSVPWPAALAVALLALAVGMFLCWWEVERPLKMLGQELATISGGSAFKLDARRYRGRQLEIVELINEGLERFQSSVLESGVLTPPPVRHQPPAVAPPPPADFANDATRRVTIAPAQVGSSPLMSLSPELPDPTTRLIGGEPVRTPERAPLPPATASESVQTQSERRKRNRPTSLNMPLEPEMTPPPFALPPAASPPPSLPRHKRGLPPGAFDKLEDSAIPTEVRVADAVPAHATAVGEDEIAYRKVFEQFTALKRKSGEPDDPVSFTKFADKLRSNRADLMRKLGCDEVRFEVYVKDGKAAVKATPIRRSPS